MSSFPGLKPIKVWGHNAGPNPYKVTIILEELGLPYDHEVVEADRIKIEPFISLNPNGRLPAIEDPNTGVTLFESGAIIDYIITTYDKSNTLHSTEPHTYWQQKAFAHFQMSGQGPIFGNRFYFKMFENIASASDRFARESKRVVSVLDAHLKKTGKPYLTGDQVSYADLMWITWNTHADFAMPEGTDAKAEFPHFWKWNVGLHSRPMVKKALKGRLTEKHRKNGELIRTLTEAGIEQRQ